LGTVFRRVQRTEAVAEAPCAAAGGLDEVEPLRPIVDTSPATTIAATVNRRSRRGVSHAKWWV
jgi:hypothetical protein